MWHLEQWPQQVGSHHGHTEVTDLELLSLWVLTLLQDTTSLLQWPAQLGSLGVASGCGTETQQYRRHGPQARRPHLCLLSV